MSSVACASPPPRTPLPAALDGTAPEYAPRPIPLTGQLAAATAQLSGLAWYDDYLILLPQYPPKHAAQDHALLYAIPQATICRFLQGYMPDPLTPQAIPFYTNGVESQIRGFQGYEAIAFHEDQVFVSIEAKSGAMQGYLVTGSIAPDLRGIHLDPTTLTMMTTPARVDNAAYEALVVLDDQVLAFYEANGANLNASPWAYAFDTMLTSQMTMTVPTIEYRLTDATAADSSGRFWVVNYFFPGSQRRYHPAEDGIRLAYGTGETHARYPQVERLLELQHQHGTITRTATPPIQLQLHDAETPRNWEGVVRLADQGFLLVTDTFPETILAFVATPSPHGGAPNTASHAPCPPPNVR